MKGPHWLWQFTHCAVVLCAITASLRADLFVVWPRSTFRYDEQTGALLSNQSSNFHAETLASLVAAPNGDFLAFGNSMGWGGIVSLDGVTAQFKQTIVDLNYSGIFQPRRLGFGPTGDLFVASESGGIGRYDPTTGEFKGTFLSKEKISDRNHLMTFGPDGNIYLAAPGGIARYSSVTGEYIDLFAPLDTNIAVINFSFNADDNLFVLSRDSRVYRRDARSQKLTEIIDAKSVGMHGPRIMTIGPDGDIYLGDADVYGSKVPLDVWRFNGRSGASKGVFIHGEIPPYGDGWINAMIFSGPRIRISHGPNAPALKWPNTHGAFELQTRAGLNQPWQKVQETPTAVGCSLTLNLPATGNNSLFRLMKP